MDKLARKCFESAPRSTRICHVETNVVGRLRVKMLLQKIIRKAGATETIIYLFPMATDISMAKGIMREEWLAPDGPAAGRVYLSTYAAWLSGKEWTKIGWQGRFIFLMDMGLGHPAANMELTMATVIDWLQVAVNLNQEEYRDWALTVWSISGDNLPLATDDSLSRPLRMTNPPTVKYIRLAKMPRDAESVTIKQAGTGLAWHDDTCSLMRKFMADKPRVPTFVIVSAYKDARRIHGRDSVLSGLEFESLGPWSTAEMMVAAAKASEGKGKILHINRDVGILPAIANIGAVFVAPYLVDYTFDTEGATSIVEANIKMPRPDLLVEMVLGDTETRIVVFRSGVDDCIDQSTPALLDQGYLCCGLIHLFPGLPSDLQPYVERDWLQSASGIECLADAGLVSGGLTKLSFTDFSLFLGLETNTAALILLDSVTKMPKSSETGKHYLESAKQTRVEMAMLLSQGLSSILDVMRAEVKTGLNTCIQELAKGDTILIASEAYRGELWVLLAMLHAYRVLPIRPKGLAAIKPLVRIDVMNHVSSQVDMWVDRLGVDKINPKTRRPLMPPNEIAALEKVLAVALSDNIIATPNATGTPMLHTSKDLKLTKGHMMVNWAVFENLNPKEFAADSEGIRKAQERFSNTDIAGCRRFAVCSTLHMEISRTGVKSYQPVGLTGISASSLKTRAEEEKRVQSKERVQKIRERIFAALDKAKPLPKKGPLSDDTTLTATSVSWDYPMSHTSKK